MLGGLSADVAVGFEREHHEAGGTAVSANGRKKPLGLDRECALIIVGFAVDQEYRVFDLIGVKERRDFFIKRRRFPESPSFGLEAEGRERPVISAAAGDTGAEKTRVG